MCFRQNIISKDFYFIFHKFAILLLQFPKILLEYFFDYQIYIQGCDRQFIQYALGMLSSLPFCIHLDQFWLKVPYFLTLRYLYANKVGFIQFIIQGMSNLNLNKVQIDELEAYESQDCENLNLVQRNMGGWTKQEQKKYVQFLCLFRKTLQSRQLRKNTKIFKQMAQFVGSRDGIQCRSHHIKQLRTHRQIRKIIEYYGQPNQFTGEPRRLRAQMDRQYCEYKNCQIKNWKEIEEENSLKDKNYEELQIFRENNFFMMPSLGCYQVFYQFPCYQSQLISLVFVQNAAASQVLNISP